VFQKRKIENYAVDVVVAAVVGAIVVLEDEEMMMIVLPFTTQFYRM
jgi:hypothetical protein